MVSGKLNIADFMWFFSSEENEAIIYYLQNLVLSRTPEVEEFLSLLTDGKVPLSGFSAVMNYFELTKALKLPAEKRNFVYDSVNCTNAIFQASAKNSSSSWF